MMHTTTLNESWESWQQLARLTSLTTRLDEVSLVQDTGAGTKQMLPQLQWQQVSSCRL